MHPGKPNGLRTARARLDAPKDYVYPLGGGRLLHTCPVICIEKPVRRCAVQLLVTLRRKPFELRVANRAGRYLAVAVKPRVARTCRAQDVVALQVDPSHPQYRRFRALPASGTLAMDREAFRTLDADLGSAYQGEISHAAASELADAILAMALHYLPECAPLDRRIAQVLELLRVDATHPLHDLATATGLSYFRLSHLFMHEMGISLRSYLLWRKVHIATKLLREMTIVEAAQRAGFSDASHLSRSFQQLHAASPSYFFGNDTIKIIPPPIRVTPR